MQAESTPVELVLKGDEGAPPLKQVFKQASKPSRNLHTVLPSMTGMPMSGCRVDDGRQLHSVPLQRPLGATLAGKCATRCRVVSMLHSATLPCQADHLGPVCTEKDGKILIEKIRDGSNAALAGLQLNDVVRATTARAKVGCPKIDCLAGGLAHHQAFAERRRSLLPSRLLPWALLPSAMAWRVAHRPVATCRMRLQLPRQRQAGELTLPCLPGSRGSRLHALPCKAT